MVDIHWECHSPRSAPQKRHMAQLRRHAHCTPRKLATCISQTWDGHKAQAQPSLRPTKSAPLWRTREPEPERLRPGRCMQPRARIRQFWQSNLEPEQCSLGKHTGCEPGANPVWLNHCQHSPYTPVIFVCSVPPSPHTTEQQPKKVTTTAPLCQGGNQTLKRPANSRG